MFSCLVWIISMTAAIQTSCCRCVFKSECIYTSLIFSCSDSEQQQTPVLASRVRGRAVGDLRLSSREAAPAERPRRLDSRLNATGLRQMLLISGKVACCCVHGEGAHSGWIGSCTCEDVNASMEGDFRSALMDTTGRMRIIHLIHSWKLPFSLHP